MPCSCGFTTNQDNTCNGNHKIVKTIKDKIIDNVNKLLDSQTEKESIALLQEVIKIIKESK
jgi:uncharacterized protein YaaR (DUF327 family)